MSGKRLLAAISLVCADYIARFPERFRGIAGATGPAGVAGPKGDKGDKGDRGERGLKGDTGAQGQKGDKGDKGDAGRDGIDGKDGPEGRRGEKGDKGDRGAQGPKGERGLQGPPGPAGQGAQVIALGGGGGGGGVSAHGLLTGLSADDHPQYLNEERADLLYDPLGAAAAVEASLGALATLSAVATAQIDANAVTTAKNGEIVYADGPNTNFDVGASTPQTLFTKSVTGIAVGDQIIVDVWMTLFNNSGGNKTYTAAASLGSLSVSAADSTAIAASATNRAVKHAQFMFTVSATNLTNAIDSNIGGSSGAANAGASLTGGTSTQTFNSSSSDLTGTQTVSGTLATSATGNTQTVTLHRVEIRKVARKL